MIAGSDTENGRANSLTERCGFSASRASIARRVGSESAAKVRSSAVAVFIYLTMWLSIKTGAKRVNAGPCEGPPAAAIRIRRNPTGC